jgi:hypothetical protein
MGGRNTGGSSAGDGGAAGVPNHVVKDCSVGPVGVWQNITPEGITYGQGFVLDPQNTAVVHLTGGTNEGRRTSTDCGNTWTIRNTGENGENMRHEGSWTIAIDPVDSQVLYANLNYAHMGVFKTTNGGVDWAQMFKPPATEAFVEGGFVEHISLDPTDHLHLTVTPHFGCKGSYDVNCMVESRDGGETWRVLEGTPGMGEGGGHVMLDATTWYWMGGTSGPGLWRTTNGGGSWSKLRDGQIFPTVYRAAGAFYVPSGSGILKSTNGASFEPLPNSPNSVGLAGDGTSLFASWQWAPGYHQATLAAPSTWSQLGDDVAMAVAGWMLEYDADHHLLYSANTTSGFWRMTVK